MSSATFHKLFKPSGIFEPFGQFLDGHGGRIKHKHKLHHKTPILVHPEPLFHGPELYGGGYHGGYHGGYGDGHLGYSGIVYEPYDLHGDFEYGGLYGGELYHGGFEGEPFHYGGDYGHVDSFHGGFEH